MPAHEIKSCPRCKSAFECKSGDITHCQCHGVQFSEQEKTFIEGRYDDCLCRRCLNELKHTHTMFREKYLTQK